MPAKAVCQTPQSPTFTKLPAGKSYSYGSLNL